MKKNMFGIVIVAVFIIFFFIPLFPVISFSEAKADEPQMYFIDIDQNTTFQIRFTHSIHRTDVLETYEIEDHKIKLVSMEYEDVSIGMPAYAEEGQMLLYEDGKYKLYSNRVLENFVLYVGDINMDLFFYYGGKAYDLKKNLQRGNSYTVEIKSVSLYDKMKGVRMKHGN
ncbi:DUF1850 domain-containing protein [Ureibacillus sp. FSL K6-3587]|uniref:DUF1850 domain-containing protein n=1 Tax=Ureibacillus sp. FSL K6-3587 TaxID=2954681 RepID=UPI0031590D83